jgi:ADP-ribosylglycohydrolase
MWAALHGAVMGAELGLRHQGTAPGDEGLAEAIAAPPPWGPSPEPLPNVGWITSLAPLLHATAQAYAEAGGRITPEQWAAALRAEHALFEPGFFWLLDVYSATELLREGMSPRLTGVGSTPSGTMAVACLPVGVYHAGDPDSAYVDGVEVASVVQRRPATDWAALAAAAVAAALIPGATADSVKDAVFEVAERRCSEVATAMRRFLGRMHAVPLSEFASNIRTHTEFAEWWAACPPAAALAVLDRFGDTPDRLLNLAARLPEAHVHAPVVFAIVGALWGESVFPEEWRGAAAPLAEPLRELLPVVQAKLRQERVVIRETEALLQTQVTGEVPLYERIYGCLLAGAIGNAMGSPAEGALYPQVDERHPYHITTILDPARLEGEDDNQMAMHLTNTYLRQEGRLVTARDFGATWMSDMKREGFWLCCRSTYDLLKGGFDPRISGHWNWVTGSTVMCMEPVGLYHVGDHRSAYLDATAISYMEQRGLDVTAAAILASSVAEALRPGATVHSVCEAALNAAPDERLRTFDDRGHDTPHDFIARCLEVASRYTDVLAARAELYEKCLYYHHIDPLELLGLSYAMFMIARGDVRQAAIGGTNIGRDADTISGRAAMLAGTLRGAGSVPDDWVALVGEGFLSHLQDVARQFVALHADHKLPALRQRQDWFSSD